MKLWTLLFNREVKSHEAFQPTDEQRECGTSAAFNARVEGERTIAAAMEAADAALAALHAAPRPTARVFLIRSPRVPLYPLALYFKTRGYRLKQDGRGYVEVIR